MQMGFKLNLFKKILLYFLLVVVIPTVSISSIYVYSYSVELKDKYHKLLDTDMYNLSTQLQMLTSQVDRLTLQLSLLTNLNSLLSLPDGAGLYDYYVLQNNLSDQVSVNGMTESAYIYFQLSDRILTTNEGLYSRETFYDKSMLERFLANGNKPYEYQVRQVAPNLLQPPVEVISFDRTLSSTGKYALGHLVINVKKDKFFEAFHQMTQSDSGDNFIVDLQNNETLYQSGNNIPSNTVAGYFAGQTLLKRQDTTTVQLNGQKYFLSYQTIQPNSWLLVKLIPYMAYEQEFYSRLKSTAITTSVIMVLGLLLSYMFALMVYSPWRKIITRYHSIFNITSPNQILDEYSLVSEGIDHLLYENKRVMSAIEQVEPLVKHKLIFDLLHDDDLDPILTSRLLEQNAIRFNSPYFTVCIVAPELKTFEKSADFSKIKLVLFGLTKNAFHSRFEVAGTLLDEGRFAFILGLSEDSIKEECPDSKGMSNSHMDRDWKQGLTDLCQNVNETVQNKFSTGLQFSFGKISNSIFELHESYTLAKRGFKYKALLNKSDVVFITEMPSENTFPYPILLQKMVTDGIKIGDKKQTGDAITALFQQYVYSEKFPLDKIQQMIVIFMSTVIHELISEGYDMDELEPDHIVQIDDCSNNQDLERLIRGHINHIIDKLDLWENNKSDNIYVLKTIRYMEENFRCNISISDIADYVGISPNYLSRIFKAETGSSPLDYMTRCRINHGKRLLVDEKRYSLQEIGNQIGYNDVQSFIRFFKKYEGITPNIYRKMALQEKENSAGANVSVSPHPN